MNRCGLEPCVIGLWGSVRNKHEINLVAVATNTCCIILRCVVLRNTLEHSSFPTYIIMTGYHSISLLASEMSCAVAMTTAQGGAAIICV